MTRFPKVTSMRLELRRSRESIYQVIAESVSGVGNVAQKGKVILQTSLPCEHILVSCDCVRIKQMGISMLLNAVHAIPADGTVRISICVSEGNLFIDVIECGCRIPLDRREEIFLPFVTTNNDGTGLRLPIANKIVEAHSGCPEIIDNPERGLTFRVILPV